MSRNLKLLEQTGNGQELFRTSGSPSEPVAPAIPKPVPVNGKGIQPQPSTGTKNTSLPIQWLNRIREGARAWREQAPGPSHHSRADGDLVAREEEIKLVQRVFRPANGRATHVVLFCGVEADSGCAAICAHASEILAAEPDESVCVVDANLRSPSIHRYFGMENDKGLAAALLEAGPVRDFAQQLPERNLWVIPSGHAAANLSISLFSERLRARLTELRATFKHVVVLSAPFGLETDPLLLSRWTDGVVLVLEANSTRREAARRVKESLEASDIRLLGVVLNNRTFPIPDALYRRL